MKALLLLMLLHLTGLGLFLKGFFPIKVAVPGHATWANQTLEPSTDQEVTEILTPPDAMFQRLVIVLIDALRADFVLPISPNHTPNMAFVHEKIVLNESFSFLTKAHPPTVTMPRIKALTTGGIPGFIDFVLNFEMSNSLIEDNLITQLRRAGKRIVFYGDDTWMKMFPGHFERTDGTFSFFVTDYTEVDDNVTRHLADELQLSADWDVMVLHYLGLDHIGHIATPHSPLVPPKLREMDAIVRRIYDFLQEKDAREGSNSLLVVCGDHGMSDKGSHGGATHTEIATPFIFLSPAFQHHQGGAFDVKSAEVYQIDMVPGLSLLLALPPPQNSLGVLPPSLLQPLGARQRLQWLYVNAQQLYKVYATNQQHLQSSAISAAYTRVLERHKHWLASYTKPSLQASDLHTALLQAAKIVDSYQTVMVEMRDEVARSLANYDLHAMGVAICIIWMVFVSLLCMGLQHKGVPCSHASLTTCVAVLGAVGAAVQLTVCTGRHGSDVLCGTGAGALGVNALLLAALAIAFSVITQDYSKTLYERTSSITKALVCGTVLHTVSMLSSSYIEEEHQTWYFSTQSLNVFLICYSLTLHRKARNFHLRDKLSKRSDTLHGLEQKSGLTDGFRQYNSSLYSKSGGMQHTLELRSNKNHETESNSEPYKDKLTNRGTTRRNVYHQNVNHEDKEIKGDNQVNEAHYKRDYFSCVWRGVVMTVLCLVLRRWNQTGDKWAHLPDIGDWLVRPDNTHILSLLCAGSLLITCAVIQAMHSYRLHWCQRLLFCMGAFSVYCFRSASDVLLFPGVYDATPSTKGVFEARVTFVIALLLVITTIVRTVSIKNSDNREVKSDSYPLSKNSNSDGKRPFVQPSKLEILYSGLQVVFILIGLLLMRPHNMSVIAMDTLLLLFMEDLLLRLPFKGVTMVTVMYLWMGQASFFYQGNSNSLSSIDVSAGYVGMTEFHVVLINLLLGLSIHRGPLMYHFSLVTALCRLAAQSRRSSQFDRQPQLHAQQTVIHRSAVVIFLCRVLPVAVYVLLVTSQRYHLFVWTVFSPKLLYEAIHSVVVCVEIVLLLFCERVCR